jgi:hypothetical protein
MPTYTAVGLPQEPGLDGRFTQYRTLDGPNERDVLYHLRCPTKLVQPIMARRGWRVDTLSEFAFEPPHDHCIGMTSIRGNTAVEISLCVSYCLCQPMLKPDELIDVMLHELTHIKRRRHSPLFRWTMARLAAEFRILMRQNTGTQSSLKLLRDRTNVFPRREKRTKRPVKEDENGQIVFMEPPESGKALRWNVCADPACPVHAKKGNQPNSDIFLQRPRLMKTSASYP